MAKAQLFWDSSVSAYRLKMQGDYAKIEKIVQFLKAQIPHSDRNLDVQEDPKTHRKDYTWTFTEKYFDGTVKFLHLIFGSGEVAVITRQQVEAAQQPRMPVHSGATPLAQACFEFLKAIPYDAARQAYRKAAMMLHPDVNKQGDIGDMSKVNALWSKIEKEVYNQ